MRDWRWILKTLTAATETEAMIVTGTGKEIGTEKKGAKTGMVCLRISMLGL